MTQLGELDPARIAYLLVRRELERTRPEREADVEVFVFRLTGPGRDPVDVHVEEARSEHWGKLHEANLLSHLSPSRELEGQVARLDVTTGLDQEAELLVKDQEDTPAIRRHDESARGEMAGDIGRARKRIRVLEEREHAFHEAGFPRIRRRVAAKFPGDRDVIHADTTLYSKIQGGRPADRSERACLDELAGRTEDPARRPNGRGLGPHSGTAGRCHGGPTPSATELARGVMQERTSLKRQAGKYLIVEELGRGGTATVYLAVARGPGAVNKLVVLKTLHPEFAEDPAAVTAFLEEARLAAFLSHPNVVQTYEVETTGNESRLVMEYLEGQPLSRLLQSCEASGARFPDAMHLHVLVELLVGLHYSHELRSYEGTPLELVHRDVSPQNVFVTYEGLVKVLDFGIAKTTASVRTATGVLKGKLAYMAPEQMSGGPIDRRADVFSAGCMLWAAAAGRRLWKGQAQDSIVTHVLNGDIPSPRSVNPYCPPELETIVMKALEVDPERRYPSALGMQMDLEAFMESHGLIAKQRELGALVSRLFARERAQLQGSIERELARVRASETTPPPREHPTDTLPSLPPPSLPPPTLRPSGERSARSLVHHFIFWGSAVLLGLAASLLTWPRVRPLLTASPSRPLPQRETLPLIRRTLPHNANVTLVESATPERARLTSVAAVPPSEAPHPALPEPSH